MTSFAALLRSAKIGLSKWIFYVKNYLNLSDFFSLKNKNSGAHFLLNWFFGNFDNKTTFLLKSGPIFDKASKLGKATQDAYNLSTIANLAKINYLSNIVIETQTRSYSNPKNMFDPAKDC